MKAVSVRCSALLLSAMAVTGPAVAVEGGLGRSITGLQVADYAGIIPPTPGLSLSLAYIHYSGDISARRTIPLNGQAVLGLDASFDLYSATAIYVWPAHTGAWNFASIASLPIASVDLAASLGAGALQRRVTDEVSGRLYDMSFVPFIAGYHFDRERHLSIGLYVSAPTGSYDAGRLANPSLNVWVYSPTISYTQLGLTGTLDWSTTLGVDVSSWNHATNYRSGTVLHLDTQLVKHTPGGWSIGATAAWLGQTTDDSGALADRLNGFRGSGFAAGAIVGFEKKMFDASVAVSFRWLHEFDVTRRLQGNPLMLSGTVSF